MINMVRFLNDIASESDDYDLRQIMRSTYMKGDISLSFQTEPSFFESISVLGNNQKVLVIRDQDILNE